MGAQLAPLRQTLPPARRTVKQRMEAARLADENPPAPTKHTVHVHFGRFAAAVNLWLGSTWAFAGAGVIVLVWAATGPVFHFSPAWAQFINTSTGIATFLMVFLIQNTQNRDARAINLKLNELILAIGKARNHMIDIERATDVELDAIQATYEGIRPADPLPKS